MQRAYSQIKVREGRVPLPSKVFQGFGAIVDSHSQFAFNALLLLYYNQVLGISATAVATVLAVAMVIDAITDPLMGAFSDRLKSRLGRRHLLIYLSAVPLGVMMFLLFSPPAFLTDTQLVGWLFFSVIGLRLAFTVFHVPWSALAMEFSTDYAERTEIVAWRLVSGWVGGVAFSFGMYTFVFAGSEAFPQGQLNPDSYPTFAVFTGLSMTFWCLATAHLTRSQIPYLLQPVEPTNFSLLTMLKQVWSVVLNPYYRKVVLAFLIYAAIAGFGGVFDALMNTFFWGLTGEDLRWFGFAIFGAALGIFLAARLQNYYLKQHILLAALLVNMVLAILKVCLRFMDWVPENGDPMLVWVLVAQEVLQVISATVAMTVLPSMLADLGDHQEARTGERQEGVLASVLGFAAKSTSSVGLILGGLVLDHIVGMPAGSANKSIEPDVLFRLAIADGIIASILMLIPISILATYKLSRTEIEDIQKQLQANRQRAADT